MTSFKIRRQAKFRSRDDYNNQRATQRITKTAVRFPRYKSLMSSSTGVYAFRRTTTQSFFLNTASGFNAFGFDLTLAPTLASADIYLSGSPSYTPSIPNASEFTNLFDQYRIKRVTIELFYGQNSVVSPTSTNVLPCFQIANDFNSVASFNSADMNQYPQMKTYQLGNGVTNKIVWSFQPRARADVVTSAIISSSSAMNVPSPWLDTSSTSIQHLGCRVFMNNMGITTNHIVGSLLMQIHYDLEFKFVK